MSNTIRYMVTDEQGNMAKPYIQEFDDLEGIDTLPEGASVFPAVGKYIVKFSYDDRHGCTWTVGGPGTYVDYKGIRYEADGVERLRAMLEREKIEKMLERM